MQSTLIGADAGTIGMLGGLGVRLMLAGAQLDNRFSLIEHPLLPRALGSPLHRHSREDEFSLVLEGEVGVMQGENVVIARPGELVVKPRGVWHAFWNANDRPARLLEVISPAGFEAYFAEVIGLGGPGVVPPQVMGEICQRYGLEMDPASVPMLAQRFGLMLGPPPAQAA